MEVAAFWLGGSPDASGFRAYGAVKTDGQGAFKLGAGQPHFPATLFAMDSGRRRGALVALSDAGAARQVVLRLRPLRRVSYRFQASGVADLSRTRITLQPASGPMFSQIAGAAESTVSVPPGAYTIGIAAPGGGQEEVHFEVSDRDVILPPIRLPENIAQHYGRTAPPLEGVLQIGGGSFTAGSLRGKWVLVYFWGYWCAPCVNEGLPRLRRFYDRNRDRLGAFEILAIHENGVAGTITAGELRRRLDGLTRDQWSGEALPFPVLLDSSGDIIKAWGITAYPTVALINPKGELTSGDLETLQRALDRE